MKARTRDIVGNIEAIQRQFRNVIMLMMHDPLPDKARDSRKSRIVTKYGDLAG
jgi:hypothetical protein